MLPCVSHQYFSQIEPYSKRFMQELEFEHQDFFDTACWTNLFYSFQLWQLSWIKETLLLLSVTMCWASCPSISSTRNNTMVRSKYYICKYSRDERWEVMFSLACVFSRGEGKVNPLVYSPRSFLGLWSLVLSWGYRLVLGLVLSEVLSRVLSGRRGPLSCPGEGVLLSWPWVPSSLPFQDRDTLQPGLA